MSRIAETFAKKNPFIAYLTAGDGGLDYSLQCFLALIEGGADLLEIGIPFSDPVADGPVIQKAMQRALQAKVTVKDVLAIVKRIRAKSNVPIVLFGYYNPILSAGENFLKDVKEAGADGLLIVDLAFEEPHAMREKCRQQGLDLIYLIAPSTNVERIRMIEQKGSGFLYCVARKGTTGMRNALPEGFHERLHEIKANTHLPIACGFGVSSSKMAQEMLNSADGFVVGSYFVKAIEDGVEPEELVKLARAIDPRGESK